MTSVERLKFLADKGDECWLGLSNVEAIKDVLNELEKKEAEIDKLRNTNKNLLKKLRNRVKEVKKLTRYSLYKKEFTRLNKQLEKKEKVIDLMAEYIHNTSNGEIYDIVCKEECENRNCIFAIGDNKEQEIDCIKQYFYKKAEEK